MNSLIVDFSIWLWPSPVTPRKKLHRFCTIFAPEKVFCGLPSLPHKALPMHCVCLVQFVPGHLLDPEKSNFGKEKVKKR